MKNKLTKFFTWEVYLFTTIKSTIFAQICLSYFNTFLTLKLGSEARSFNKIIFDFQLWQIVMFVIETIIIAYRFYLKKKESFK